MRHSMTPSPDLIMCQCLQLFELWSYLLLIALQNNYSKYVEPYVNKIPRASTSTSSQAPTMPSNTYSSADSAPLSQPKSATFSQPKKVI